MKVIQSHLYMYDKPKVATVKGYIETVYGMLISQHYNDSDCITTVRTLLTGEELNTNWKISDDENDYLTQYHILKNFPNISIDDVSMIIRQTNGVSELEESFYELKKLGCIVPQSDEPIIASIYLHENEYILHSKDVCLHDIRECWIPETLSSLYAIQTFLKRRIVLIPEKDKEMDATTLAFMNDLLENQLKNKVRIANKYTTQETLLNDGVYTYGVNGSKTEMTRKEFLDKYPDSDEL